MRIAMLCPSYLPTMGGREIVVHNLASVVDANPEVEVSVIVPYQYWRSIHHLVPYNILPILPMSDRFHFKLRKFGLLASVAEYQLAAYQLQYRFNLWHVHTAYPSGGFASPFLQKKGIPAILTCHGGDIRRVPEINYGARLNPAKDVHIRKTLSQYSRHIAISDSIRQELLACGVEATRIVDIPNGADIHRIQALDVDTTAVHTKLGIPPGCKMILSVGRNTPVKGFDLIPQIITKLLKTCNNFRWVLIGPRSEELMPLAIAEGVGEYLICVPSTGGPTNQSGFEMPNNELIQYYKSATLYVSTSRSEGFGIVLIEAMAAGVPLISTDAAGCRDVVTPEVGYTSAVDDHLGLAHNILRVLNDPMQLATFRENCLVQSLQYDWSVIGKRHIEEYESLCR